jgi:hypothetical protein
MEVFKPEMRVILDCPVCHKHSETTWREFWQAMPKIEGFAITQGVQCECGAVPLVTGCDD